MNALKRISRVFESSDEITFGSYSKIVLMSDCHRGDGSWSDSFAENRNLYHVALRRYYAEGYTYIELGDGDELWENKRLSEIICQYENTFELLSKFYFDKRLYFLYGNHDMDKKASSFTDQVDVLYKLGCMTVAPLFPDIKVHEGLVLKHSQTGKKLFLIHGHQADFFNGTLWRVSKFLVRHLWRHLELLGIKDPTSTSKNNRRKNKVEKTLMQWADNNKQLLIAGHTHKPLLPEPGSPLYFNSGSAVFRDYITAIEITYNHISLVKWSLKTRDDGTIYVGRDLLVGPKRLSDYF